MSNDWNKPIWYLDYPLMLLYAAWLGRFVQLAADSSEYRHDKVVETVTTAIYCFLAAIVIGIILRAFWKRFPVWVVTALLGSIFFAVGYGIVIFVARSNIGSILAYAVEKTGQLVSTFLVQTVLFFVPIFLILLSIRVIELLYRKYRQLSVRQEPSPESIRLITP